MNSKHLIYADRAIGFVFVCIVAFATGITAKEIVWGLYISSVVSGVVALMLKMFAVLMLSYVGYATWSIIPLVAIVQFPEDFITRWGPKAPLD